MPCTVLSPTCHMHHTHLRVAPGYGTKSQAYGEPAAQLGGSVGLGSRENLLHLVHDDGENCIRVVDLLKEGFDLLLPGRPPFVKVIEEQRL